MPRLRPLLLLALIILLAACGPDRAQTIDPPPAASTNAATPQSDDEPTAVQSEPPNTEPAAEPPADPTATTEPPSTTDVEEDTLLNALLTLDDMPTGWTGTAPEFELRTPGGTYSYLCVDDLPARSIANASVDFEKSSFGPFLSHSVTLYPDRETAEAAFEDTLTAVNACPTFTDDAGNANTLSPLAFPTLGDDTFAVRSSGVVEMDIITIRVDNALITILQGGLGAADSTLTETFARAAVERYGR